MDGYTAQSAVWEIPEDDDSGVQWVTSQWTSTSEEKEEKESACAAATAQLPELAKGLWMMDTGRGHDLINKAMADGYSTAFGTSIYVFDRQWQGSILSVCSNVIQNAGRRSETLLADRHSCSLVRWATMYGRGVLLSLGSF